MSAEAQDGSTARDDLELRAPTSNPLTDGAVTTDDGEPVEGDKELTARVIDEVERECLAASQPPATTFTDIWAPMLDNTDADEISDDISGLMGTLGVVAALIMSFMFGQNGQELTLCATSMWGGHVHVAQHTYTVLCAVVTVLCFATVCVSSRIYMDILLAPKPLAIAAVARIGGVVIIDTIYLSFFLIVLTTLLALMLNVSIILPWVVGLITLAFLLIVTAISIYSFVHTDGAVGSLIIEYQERKHEAKRKRDAAAERAAVASEE